MDCDPEEIQKIANPKARIAVINSDDEKGIHAAVDYLVELGHREIGMITGRTTTYSGLRRRESFVKRLESHGLTLDERYMLKGDFTGRSTVSEVESLIASGKLPTAMIASNDEMALAAMETFKRHGIRIPEDISIIGYDDALASSIVKPALTTVKIPFFDMAKKALEMLTELIESDKPRFMVYNADVGLVVRESCTTINTEEVSI